MIRSMLAAALLLAGVGGADAQGTIYRCGNEYRGTPCEQGRRVETESTVRTSAQRAEAMQVAAAEKKLAEEMASDRRRAEAAFKPAAAGSLGPARPAATKAPPTGKGRDKARDKGKKKGGSAEGEDFVAVVPASKS